MSDNLIADLQAYIVRLEGENTELREELQWHDKNATDTLESLNHIQKIFDDKNAEIERLQSALASAQRAREIEWTQIGEYEWKGKTTNEKIWFRFTKVYNDYENKWHFPLFLSLGGASNIACGYSIEDAKSAAQTALDELKAGL